MAARILQVNFRFSVTASEYEDLATSLAQAFADVSGLVWKIWILNKAEREAGGIYCFDRAESLQQFLASQLAADVRDHPAVSEFSGGQPTRCRCPRPSGSQRVLRQVI
jgi:hypothetical protein